MRKILVVLILLVSTSIYAQDANFYLRVAHFSPALDDEVEVTVDDENMEPVKYKTVGDAIALPEGQHVIKLTSEDKTLTVMVEAVSGDHQILVVIGANEPTTLLIDEDRLSLVEGESRMIILNAMEGADAVDVLVDQSVFYPELTYGTLFSADLIPNTYHLAFETIDNVYVTALENLQLNPGAIVLIVLMDTLEDPFIYTGGLYVNEPVDTGENSPKALLRFAQLSSGTPALDFYLNGELTDFSDVAFPEFTAWMPLDAGTYTLAIAFHGDPFSEAIVGPIELVLEEGTYSTAATIGTLVNNTLQAHIVEEDFSPIDRDQFRLGVLNAYPGSGAVNVEMADTGQVMIESLGYPGFFGDNDGFTEVILTEGTYDLEFNDGTSTLLDLTGTNFIEGRNYFIALISANPPFLLTFSDIEETVELMEEK